MTRNLILRVEDGLLRRCRKRAVEEDKSLSCWVSGVLDVAAGPGDMSYQEAKKKAMGHLKKGFDLGGTPFRRESLYAKPWG